MAAFSLFQWDIPRLRTVLEGVLSDHHPIDDYDVEQDFPAIGTKAMLLNARRFESVDLDALMILCWPSCCRRMIALGVAGGRIQN